MWFASTSLRSRQPALRRCSGIARNEWIWVALLLAVCSFAILGSLKSDESGRDYREAEDELIYLAGQIRYALEVDDQHGEAWPSIMATEGDPPDGLDGASSLSEALGTRHFLPTDPWGRAYVCEKRRAGQWDVWCAGPKGARLLDGDLAGAREQRLLIELRLPPSATAAN